MRNKLQEVARRKGPAALVGDGPAASSKIVQYIVQAQPVEDALDMVLDVYVHHRTPGRGRALDEHLRKTAEQAERLRADFFTYTALLVGATDANVCDQIIEKMIDAKPDAPPKGPAHRPPSDALSKFIEGSRRLMRWYSVEPAFVAHYYYGQRDRLGRPWCLRLFGQWFRRNDPAERERECIKHLADRLRERPSRPRSRRMKARRSR